MEKTSRYNDRIITDGLPDGWYIQDRICQNAALLLRRTDFGLFGWTCICTRPRAMSTDDWILTAQIIAHGFERENTRRQDAADAQEAVGELDDEGEIIRRLLAGETICYSQDGDDAWLSGGDKASLSERAILQLRKAGYLTRKNDDEGRVSWDEASAALRAIVGAGEAG
jgi:hypothetical protein